MGERERERERTRVRERYSKSFPSNKVKPYFWIQVSHNMIITPASAPNVSHSPCELKNHGRAEGEKDVLAGNLKTEWSGDEGRGRLHWRQLQWLH